MDDVDAIFRRRQYLLTGIILRWSAGLRSHRFNPVQHCEEVREPQIRMGREQESRKSGEAWRRI